ncbi:phasin family protein [Aestuariivirga sp.]|uniref:phasin family protein n=1 Tax=Aestuariivirga sp. TaxID=2650926 RepID=UPI0039E4FD30
MKSFEDMQVFGKEGFEAMVASGTAMTKGLQAIAQEVADYSRKSVELGQGAFEKVTAARSFERVLEVQQGYAKEAYETFVAQATKLNEMYTAAAKEAYKPYEATFAAFGVKAPK